MFYKIAKKLDHQLAFEEVDAHCDIPCGIYDPHHALIGALTVIRMVDLINKLVEEQEEYYQHKLTRMRDLTRCRKTCSIWVNISF